MNRDVAAKQVRTLGRRRSRDGDRMRLWEREKGAKGLKISRRLEGEGSVK